jgi:hypothetical protein
MPQLLVPKRELRIARAKCKHGIRQRAAVYEARMDAHKHSTVMATFDIPGMEMLQGRFCPD